MKEIALSPAKHGPDAGMLSPANNSSLLTGAQSPKDQSAEKSVGMRRSGDGLPIGYAAPRITMSRKLKESVFQTNIDNRRKQDALKRKYYGIEEDYYIL